MKKYAAYIIGLLLVMVVVNADAAILIGTEYRTGSDVNIWLFDTETCSFTLQASHTVAVRPNTFNGNGLDFMNNRFYFSAFSGVAPSPLYFSDFVDVFAAGTLDGGAACGAFYNGNYYYVKDRSDDLMEVRFDESGYKVDETKIADVTDNTKTLRFGDIVFDEEGTLYGYGRDAAVDNGQVEFFIFNPAFTPSYTSFPQGVLIQLAFGSDGVLYGHSTDTGAFFTVDLSNGNLTPLCVDHSPAIKLSDLAGFPPESVPLTVPVDIKPGSCPNPLQRGGEAKLPVAILGTDTFDVRTIDPESVRLEGVPAIRWNFAYAAQPYEPYSGKEFCTQCTRKNDGIMDLVFIFEKKAVIAALGDVEYGECRVVRLTGKLLDGTEIAGEDVMVIKIK